MKFIEKYKEKITYTNIHKNIIFLLVILKVLETFDNFVVILEETIKDYLKDIDKNLKTDLYNKYEIEKISNKKLYELYEILNDLNFNKLNEKEMYYLFYYIYTEIYPEKDIKNVQHMTTPDFAELKYKLNTIDKKNINEVYDPTCGIGMLFIPFLKENKNVKIYGQEIDNNLIDISKLNLYYVSLLNKFLKK